MADVPFLETGIVYGGIGYPMEFYQVVDGEHEPLEMWYRVSAETSDPGPIDTGPFVIADMLEDTPFYVAHRCGGNNWPEFSERGILESIALGYKALEVSVYQCASGEFVCSHDWTTERMTGVNHEIWNTPWSTLSALTSTAANTTDPSQSRTPLLRLSDVFDLAPGHVIFLDHKATSAGVGNPLDQSGRDDLLDYLDTIPDAKDRVIWKSFKAGWVAAEMAKARGYTTWGIYYGNEYTIVPTYTQHFDMLGLVFNDPVENWQQALGTGKPVIAHIVTNPNQHLIGLSRGASGIMTSNPLQFGP